MNFSSIPILATAISIVICWALFAILCSLLHEAIAQLKAERGRFMKKYLFQQLQDFPNGVNWASLLYLHGTIDLLSRSPGKPTSDISPHLFAETLVEVIGKTHAVRMKTEAGQNDYRNPLLFNFKSATQVLQPSDVISFFQQALDSAELSGVSLNGKPDEAQVYKNLVANIEQWYQQLMERLSLWYKKKTRERLFFLGLVLAIVINVDSIQLFTLFSSQPASRASVMSFYEKNANTLSDYAAKLENQQTVDSAGLKEVIRQSANYIHSADSLAKMAQLPVGIRYSVFGKELDRSGEYYLWWKLIGVLITGFAASFGAPFWFDLLKKVYSRKV